VGFLAFVVKFFGKLKEMRELRKAGDFERADQIREDFRGEFKARYKNCVNQQ